jgi:hypothetical protein
LDQRPQRRQKARFWRYRALPAALQGLIVGIGMSVFAGIGGEEAAEHRWLIGGIAGIGTVILVMVYPGRPP